MTTPFPEAGFIPGTSLSFTIARDSRCFDGHFDGAPILPGVAQVALALTACHTDRVLTGIRDVRFRRPIGPGAEVEVLLTEGNAASTVRFEIRLQGETMTTGVLLFA